MSPSGKAPGFGPGISEVRVLPSQFLRLPQGSLFYGRREPQSEALYWFERERAEAGEFLQSDVITKQNSKLPLNASE